MKFHLFLALAGVLFVGCELVGSLLTPPTDPVTGEVVGDSTVVELFKQVAPLIPKEEGKVSWTEMALAGLMTAQNAYLAKRKLAQRKARIASGSGFAPSNLGSEPVPPPPTA